MIMKYKHFLLAAASSCGIATALFFHSQSNADHAKSLPLQGLSEPQQAALEHANQLSTAFQCVADELLPSVVAIESIKTKKSQNWPDNPQSPLMHPPFGKYGSSPFDEMFEQLQRDPRSGPPATRQQPKMVNGIGTGVIIDPVGIVITNHHVIADSDEIRIQTHDGREFLVKRTMSDPKTDIAVLELENASDLTAATFGDSDQTGVGEWVLALGQPFGLENSVTAGIISAKQRGIGIADRESFIQTDAAINPGNSGGPLVNLRGEVIGINTAIHSKSGGNNGIGFAVPSNIAKWVADQLLNHGDVNRAYLGIAMQAITSELAEHLNVEPRNGVVVTDVVPGSPAEKAGLQVGDVITNLGSHKIEGPKELQLAVEQSTFDNTYQISVTRDHETLKLTYVAKPNPIHNDSKGTESRSTTKNENQPTLGIHAEDLHSQAGEQSPGIRVVAVDADSAAERAGVQVGMVVLQANRQVLESLADLREACSKAVESKRESVLLLVESEGGKRFLVVPLI